MPWDGTGHERVWRVGAEFVLGYVMIMRVGWDVWGLC